MGGQLINGGRAKIFVNYSIAACITCCIMQWLNIPCLLLGKFLHGVTVTTVHIAV